MNSIIEFGQKYALIPSELNVLDLMLQRMTNPEIQKELGYKSEQAVKNIAYSIYRKIGVNGHQGRAKVLGLYQEFVDIKNNVKDLVIYRQEFKEFLKHRTEFLSFLRRKQALQVSMGL